MEGNFLLTINDFYPFGGLEKNFLRIVRACREKGHRITVLTMSWQGEKPEGLEVVKLPAKGWSNHRRAKSFVNQFLNMGEKEKYDLVIGFNRMPGLDLYYAADVCYIIDIARRRGFLSRLTPRYRVYAEFEKEVFGPGSATHIMYLSEAQKENYIRAYKTPEKRFHFLPPGIDAEKIKAALNAKIRRQVRNEFGLTDKEHLLLAVGSDFKRKGLARSIVAVASLPKDLREKTSLIVIGKGETKRFARLARKADIFSRVHFLGGRADVPRFFAAADMLLHPAVTENTGNVILEAMVAGLPVLATETCGYSFHIKKAGAGTVLKNPFRQKEMNRLLYEMIAAASLKELGKNGHAYAEREDLYSRPQAAVKIIEELAARKKQGGTT